MTLQQFNNQFVIYIVIISCIACKQKEPTEKESNPVITGLTEQISETPDDPSLYALRAGAYYELERYESAVQDLQQALRYDSTNLEYIIALADVYFDDEKKEQAIATLQKARKKFPKDLTISLKIADFQYLSEEYEASLVTAQQALRQHPRSAELHYWVGLNQQQLANTQAARLAYEKAIELDPRHVNSYLQLTKLLQNDTSNGALQYFDKAISLDSNNVELLFAKASYLQNRKQHQAAIDLFREINGKDPQFVEAYLGEGKTHLELQDWDGAYRAFDIAIKNNPALVEAYYYRGFCSEKQGNKEEAVADYEQCLNFDPEFQLAINALKNIK